eukprot:TRINITY_DN298_c0_g1_i1.p1 TRINITY_DN298_c0_g1~~TRINITY_DN298_c0_g1_i1.p1  ORF type:complete len:775 (-),score=142.76 TRINITY_DN298_c0_g1_i1:117-2441(-)
MSLKAIIDFGIHFESFKNIDLFHQGLYHLRFSIYQQREEHRIFAHPYSILEGPKTDVNDKKKKASTKDHHSLMPSHFLEGMSAYCSKTFLIRFCEEEVVVNETCLFRMEIEAFPRFADLNMFCEVELMYADLLNLGGMAGLSSLGNNELKVDFKSVSVFRSKLHRVSAGIREFVPICFDEGHFCVANSMFHSSVIDFRFRIHESEPSAEKRDSIDALPSNLYPKNFTEFLFNASKFRKEDLNQFYNNFLKPLRKTFTGLAIEYNDTLNRLLSEARGRDFRQYVESRPSKLPPPSFFEARKNETNTTMDEEEKKELPSIKPKTMGDKANSSLSQDRDNIANELDEDLKGYFLGDFIDGKDPEKIAMSLLQEINQIAGHLYTLWHSYLGLMMVAPKTALQGHYQTYIKRIQERWGECMFHERLVVDDLAHTDDEKSEENPFVARKVRKQIYYHSLEPQYKVEDLNLFPTTENQTILFEQLYVRSSSSEAKKIIEDKDYQYTFSSSDAPRTTGIHLVVFVHGFQGTSWDLRLLKNNLALIFPELLFLCSSANEDHTHGDIGDMGIRLAQEVTNYITEWCPGNTLGRLTFIGHSLGGLIIRSALPFLEQYSSKMFSFITLSSPHLGYMITNSKMIDAGMWILKKWRKSLCLQQLSMEDSPDLRQTYLYKLSQYKGLCWFKNIALCSSHQDSYAPFASARMSASCRKAEEDPARGPVYITMVKSIISQLTSDHLYRVNVDFKIAEKNIDAMIGRTAHILFLENQPFQRMFIHRYAHFFR